MKAIDYPNVLSLMQDRCDRFAGTPLFWEKRGSWAPTTWEQFGHAVQCFASALLKRGLNRSDGVSILSANRKEWPICDMGTILAGGVSVGVYPTSSAEQCAYMIRHSDSRTIVVDHSRQLEKILSVRGDLPRIRDIVVIDPAVPTDSGRNIWNLGDFLALGETCLSEYKNALERMRSSQGPEDIIMYVYTSGTTGDPKGAMISNRYFLYNGDSIHRVFQFRPQDRIVSYLPFCHVGERIFGWAVTLIAGRQVYFVDDYSKVIDTLAEIDADVFGGVPRLYEKMYTRITGHLASLPQDQQTVVQSSMKVAAEYFSFALSNQEPPAELLDRFRTADRDVLAPLRAKVFGKNMRICTSGAAPLAREVAEFFVSIGSPIYEAYGLTENISAAINRPNRHRINTVGVPMPYSDIRLAEDGEILIGGQNRFSGYYKDEKATQAITDATGEWLYTGDIGAFDADGFLRIVDRKKELLITSTGKNIAPAPIENRLKYDTVISQAMVVGDGKSYVAALITINPFEAVRVVEGLAQAWPSRVVEALQRGQWPAEQDMRRAVEEPSLRRHLQTTIDHVNATLNHTEQIKRFLVLPFDFSIESGEITPTLKLKRKNITQKYFDLIERLYQNPS